MTQLPLLFSSVDEGNIRLSGVPLSKWEKTGDVGTFSQGKTGQDVLCITSKIPLWSCSPFSSLSKPRLSRSGTWWCSRTVKMKWTQGEASVVCIKTWSIYDCEKRITENITSQKIWRFMVLLSLLATASNHRMGARTRRATVAMTPAVCPNLKVRTSRARSEVFRCLRAKGKGWESWRQVHFFFIITRFSSFRRNIPYFI